MINFAKQYFLGIITFCLMIPNVLIADVRLCNIFSDNMVLQRNAPIPVWGWANANEKITITFNGQTQKTKADKNGNWKVQLNPEKEGGPYVLVVTGKNVLQFNNVLVGDVWLCSGQSNMEWTVQQSLYGDREIKNGANSFIRHIKIGKTINSLPQKNISSGNWEVCNAANIGAVTGVGYFFAKKMYQELKVPIGLINASWGGSNVETWTSREGFEQSEFYKTMIEKMPLIDMEELKKCGKANVTNRIENLQKNKISIERAATFSNADYDDTNWPELLQPKSWEGQSLGEMDGVVWLRKTFIVPTTQSSNSATLSLSKIDDEDITYVNGIKVGSNTVWDSKRNYSIPAGVLKAGKNIIAVRVVDNGGGGGMWGDAEELKIRFANDSISLSGSWKFQVEAIKNEINFNDYPSLIYNALIQPIVPFACKGVLWYQGESNASRAFEYGTTFPLLIKDWRTKWNNPTLPFYFVQLATFNTEGNSNNGCAWAELREAQTKTLSIPYTGMCVTTDVGDPKDIHPLNKETVGQRLAAIALNNLFQKTMVCSGPMFQGMQMKANSIEVSFKDIGSGLYTTDKYGYVKGFEIAGKDQHFYYAKATIQGDKIIVYQDNVKSPIAVRFGWSGDASDNNLFNKEGFPAVPFRTDEWKTITKDIRYSLPDLCK